ERSAELRLGLLVAAEAEVGDSERLPDRRLVRLAALGLLQRHSRLRGLAAPQPPPAFLEELVGVGHSPLRYPKFSSTKSNGSVKPRVGPISIPATRPPSSMARWTAVAFSNGGPGSESSCACTRFPKSQSGAPASAFAGSSSRTRVTRPFSILTAERPGPGGGRRRTAMAPSW